MQKPTLKQKIITLVTAITLAILTFLGITGCTASISAEKLEAETELQQPFTISNVPVEREELED